MRAFQVVGLPLLKPIGKDGSALSVVVNAQADAQRSGSSVVIIGRTESTYRRSAPATTTQSRLRTVITAVPVTIAVTLAVPGPSLEITGTALFTPERHCDDVVL